MKKQKINLEMQLQLSKSWQKNYLALTLTIFLLTSLLLAGCGDNTPTPTITPIEPTTTPSPATSPSSAVTSPAATATSANGTTAATSDNTSATTFTTPSSSETPPPGAIRGADSRFYYIVEPILPFYKANGWLGLPLGGMREARPDGYDWDGVYQNFQRGRVEAHRDQEGKYSLQLGLVNQELLKLKGQGR